MEEKNNKIFREFLTRAEDMKTDIMADLESYLGVMPEILPTLSERTEAFVLSTLSNELYSRPDSLSPIVAELVALAAASGAGAEHCIKAHILSAMKEGASRDQILDTLLIAGHISRTKTLSIAIRAFDELCPNDQE